MRSLFPWLSLSLVACAPASEQPSVAPVSPARAAAAEEPALGEPSWANASAGALLQELTRRSCLQQTRCRSYLCAPIGAVTEVCHPARVEPRIAAALQRIENGELTLDRERALRVLEELGSDGPCRDQPSSPACDQGIDRMMEPLMPPRRLTAPLPDGVDCWRSADCKEGRICAQEGGCTLPIPPGGACGARFGPSRLSACADGLVCTHGGCGIGGDVGDACSNGRSPLDPCRQGLACRGERCVHVGDPWGPCGTDGHCPESFECSHGRCQPLPQVGEPCTEECIDGECAEGLCAPVPIGGRCTGRIFGGKRCAAGGHCDLRTEVCQPG